jgi:hypothetical protein
MAKFEIYTDKKEEFRFRLKAANGQSYFNLKATNGQVIGTSEMYAAKSGMENGIASVNKNATSAEVVE